MDKQNDLEEPLTKEELATWSKGRWLAGQHEAASNIQKRFEALVRSEHPDSDVEFSRNNETGELSYEVKKTKEQLEMEELERMEKEEEAKRLQQQEEKDEGKKKGGKK